MAEVLIWHRREARHADVAWLTGSGGWDEDITKAKRFTGEEAAKYSPPDFVAVPAPVAEQMKKAAPHGKALRAALEAAHVG